MNGARAKPDAGGASPPGLPVPQLYLVGARALFPNDDAWLEALESVARAAEMWGAAAAGGTPVLAPPGRVHLALQVRIESATDAPALAARAARRLRRANATLPLYLNADADAARLGFDGVHWPERRIPTIVAPKWRAGASVHTPAALARAVAAGAAFAVFGAIWAPAWKDVPACGLGALVELTRAATIPVLAIGGVTPARAAACRRAGAAGIAVASGVLLAPDIPAALAAYVQALQLF